MIANIDNAKTTNSSMNSNVNGRSTSPSAQGRGQLLSSGPRKLTPPPPPPV